MSTMLTSGATGGEEKKNTGIVRYFLEGDATKKKIRDVDISTAKAVKAAIAAHRQGTFQVLFEDADGDYEELKDYDVPYMDDGKVVVQLVPTGNTDLAMLPDPEAFLINKLKTLNLSGGGDGSDDRRGGDDCGGFPQTPVRQRPENITAKAGSSKSPPRSLASTDGLQGYANQKLREPGETGDVEFDVFTTEGAEIELQDIAPRQHVLLVRKGVGFPREDAEHAAATAAANAGTMLTEEALTKHLERFKQDIMAQVQMRREIALHPIHGQHEADRAERREIVDDASLAAISEDAATINSENVATSRRGSGGSGRSQ